MGVLGGGSLFNSQAGVGQQLQKQIGQTGIPVYNVANVCATGATALRTVLLTIKAGEADMGLAVGVEQMGKGGLLGAGGKGDRGRKVYEPSGRYGSVMSVEGLLGTGLMPGVFAQAGMEYAYENGGVDFEQFAKVAEKNHAHSTLEPARALPEAVQPRRGHGRGDDVVPEHAADVLPEHRRLGRGGARVGGEAAHAVEGAATARDQDLGVGAHHRSVDRTGAGAARRQHAHPQRRAAGVRDSQVWTRRISTSWSCTTASRPPSSSTTTTCSSARPVRRASSSTSAGRGATARSR